MTCINNAMTSTVSEMIATAEATSTAAEAAATAEAASTAVTAAANSLLAAVDGMSNMASTVVGFKRNFSNYLQLAILSEPYKVVFLFSKHTHTHKHSQKHTHTHSHLQIFLINALIYCDVIT